MDDQAEIDQMFRDMELAQRIERGDIPTIQNNISKKFSRYKLAPNMQTIDNTCNIQTRGINLLTHQRFLQTYYNSHPERGILLYHGTGSGKTYTSIAMAMSALHYRLVENVILLAPASLKDNYESHVNKFAKFIKRPDFAFRFELISYNTSAINNTELDLRGEKTLVVIEESHLFISMTKNVATTGLNVYKQLLNSKCRIIALSATPVLNTGYEYAVLFSLLAGKGRNGKTRFNLDKANFQQRYYNNGELGNKSEFYDKIKYLVSYYQGANEDSEVFPSKTVHHEDLNMSEFQTYNYNDKKGQFQPTSSTRQGLHGIITRNEPVRRVGKSKNDYAVAERQATGLARPGFESVPKVYRDNGIYDVDELNQALFFTEPEKYSIKFSKILDHIKESPGPVMIYSFFIKDSLNEIERLLEFNGISSVSWDGTNQDSRVDTLSKYNSPENAHGDIIKVILVSSAGAEGISLKNTRQVHIIEPYWNEVRIKQVIGRAVRICSHASLPPAERHVDIYRYFAKTSDGKDTIDHILYRHAMKKYHFDKSIDYLVKQSALDCILNKAQNLDVERCFGDFS